MNLHDDSLRAWAHRREYRAILAELDGRSDRDLAALGLGRGDLARAAFAEAARRVGMSGGRSAALPVSGRYRTVLPAPTAGEARPSED